MGNSNNLLLSVQNFNVLAPDFFCLQVHVAWVPLLAVTIIICIYVICFLYTYSYGRIKIYYENENLISCFVKKNIIKEILTKIRDKKL